MTINDTQYYKTHWAEMRQIRILAKLCPRCGKRPPIEGKKQCQVCISYMRTRRQSLPVETITKYHKHDKQWRENNRQHLRENDRKRTLNVKQEVFSHYGGKCACCGENNIMFLTIDHKNGNGSIQRKEATGSSNGGRNFYAWIRAHGYPSDFQILCWNCNCAKGHYGFCPHKQSIHP